jgi:hypothetical protein
MRFNPSVALAFLLAGAVGPPAHGVACPGTGAKVKVVVNNPTAATGQQVILRGQQITGGATCTNQATSYDEVFNLYTTGDNEFIVPGSGGLNTGMWVHRILSGATGQNQYQKKPVLFTTVAADYATVRWTFHPTVINVNVTGDAAGGSCTFNCTLRQALNRANSLVQSAPAILIQVLVSPGQMTQSADLVVGSSLASPIITIDGTDSNGNPWVVGDGFAAAQGSQDPFPRVVDLNNVTTFHIQGDNVTIKGLAITNTVSTGNPTKDLIATSRDNVRIEAVRLDGGATGLCSLSDCSDAAWYLIRMTGDDAAIVNVEGRSAYGNGVSLLGTGHQIRDSWLHHNYVHNVAATGTTLSRNLIELGGRRASDNALVGGTPYPASGIFTLSVGQIATERNLIRNHLHHAIDAVATVFGLSLSHDYLCGSGLEGVSIGAGANAVATGTGLAAVYNEDHGVRFQSTVPAGSTLTFNNDSAFASNVLCGLKNDSPVSVSADNNQWRGPAGGPVTTCHDSPDRCTPGAITCNSVQDYVDGQIVLDGSQPTFPSNVILKGQTLRFQGTLFNAIHGNPLDTDPLAECSIGNGFDSDNCCRKTAKANVCAPATSPPEPQAGRGNCVALSNWNNAWYAAPVTGVTPTTIVTELPVPFACQGSQPNEKVRVSKKNAVGTTLFGEASYCSNKASL